MAFTSATVCRASRKGCCSGSAPLPFRSLGRATWPIPAGNAAREFRAALACAPEMAEAHLNLALVYEKLNRKSESKQCLASYLRYDPQGRWAEVAREKLRPSSPARRSSSKVTPFRRARY